MKVRYVALLVLVLMVAALVAPTAALARDKTSSWKSVGSTGGVACYVQAQVDTTSGSTRVNAYGRSKTSGALITTIGSRVYLYNHNAICQSDLRGVSAWRYGSSSNYINTSVSGALSSATVSHAYVKAYGYFYKSGGSTISGVYQDVNSL